MKQQDKYFILSCRIFFSIILLLFTISGCLLFFLPQDTFSENENRYLATFKPLSMERFMDLSMQENVTDSANDQFWNRDFWMKLSTGLQHMIGFQDVGGVYFGKENYYFERILDSHLSEIRYINNLRYLEQFAATADVKTTFFPVPSSGTILKNQLPDYAVLYSDSHLYELAKKSLAHASLLDIRPDFTHYRPNNQLYFKTDHHWSMQGAYLGYAAFCKMHGLTAQDLSSFDPKCTSQSFYGTLYSKAPRFFSQPDIFFLPEHINKSSVMIDSKDAAGIYDYSKLQTKDKYGVYFGGNFGKITIQAALGRQEKPVKKLLVVKDSFANSFVPFLIGHYDEIIMLDLRYFNDSISSLMQAEHPSDILVLYELSNFAQDMNFFKILK